MEDAMPPAKKTDWAGPLPSLKYTVQKLSPFSTNSERRNDHSTAKLIVISAWRRMITTTMARRMGQHLLMTAFHVGSDIVVVKYSSQIFHKVTPKIPVYMPMSVIDQHLHMKTQNDAAHRTITRIGSLSSTQRQEIEISKPCRCRGRSDGIFA